MSYAQIQPLGLLSLHILPMSAYVGDTLHSFLLFSPQVVKYIYYSFLRFVGGVEVAPFFGAKSSSEAEALPPDMPGLVHTREGKYMNNLKNVFIITWHKPKRHKHF